MMSVPRAIGKSVMVFKGCDVMVGKGCDVKLPKPELES
jgi:hypothetical protein